jgi:hypothetical protein
MGCGKKFKEKFYYAIKVKDDKLQNGTEVDIVTIPNIPIANSILRLYNLSDKTFTIEYPKRNLFTQRYKIKQYNSESAFTSTNYQVYEEDTNSYILFTQIIINDSNIPVKPDGKYTSTVTGATGRFEGATKVFWTQYTDPKDKTLYRTFTVTGYRPNC